MPTIKTKDANTSIKTLQAATSGADKMKQSYIKTKEEAEQAAGVQGETSQTYAAGKLEQYEGMVASYAQTAVLEAPNTAKNAQQLYKKHLAVQKQKAAQAKMTQERGRALAQQKSTAITASNRIKTKGFGGTGTQPKGVVNAATQPKQKAVNDAIKTSQKAAGKTSKYIKNALYAKTATKTTKRSLELGRKLAIKTMHAARFTARAAIAAAKLAIKAAILLVKSLVAWIAAGGTVAVAIILVFVMAALIVSSPVGIFFSSESATSYSLSSVVDTLTLEYEAKIEDIKDSVEYDALTIEGDSDLDWSEILPVFAVKASTTEGENISVVMITDEQVDLLREIMWDMNEITYSINDVEITGTIPVPGDTDYDMSMTRVYLKIELAHLTAAEMTVEYAFSDFQLEQLAELQSPVYDLIWASLLVF